MTKIQQFFTLVALAGVLALASLVVFPPQGTATEDLGEPNLLRAACQSLTANALTQGVNLTKCRQASEPTSSDYGRTAILHLRVYVNECPCWRSADVFMTKSLWQNNGFVLTD